MTHRLGRALAAVSLAALAGCSQLQGATPPSSAPSGTTGGCPAEAGKALTLVVGARMGSPKPSVPEEIRALVRAAAQQSQKVQVVRVDGQPNVAMSADLKITAQNTTQMDKKTNEAVDSVVQAVGKLEPKKPEADVLTALAEAGRVTPAGGTIVLMDSGLATAGGLSYLDKSMFGAVPADMAAYLKAQALLPKLQGRSVLLVGLGGTAEPQVALDENLRGRVVEMWRAVATASEAACVADVSIASRRDAFPTQIPVTKVELPAPPKFESCGTTVLADSESVGFVPDQATLRDPGAANETLKQLAGMIANGTQRVTLVGNTASVGAAQGARDLSKSRAETVKKILTDLGVAADRIQTRGDGFTGPRHEEDLGPGGVLLPGPAARNRSVVVELRCQG